MGPFRHPGVRVRLARTLGITAALSVAGTALITFGLVRQLASKQASSELVQQANAATAVTIRLESQGTAPLKAVTDALSDILPRSAGYHVGLITPTGLTLAPEDPLALAVGERLQTRRVVDGTRIQGILHLSQGTFAYVAAPVPGRRPRGEVAGVLIARPSGLAADFWRPVILRVLLAGGIAVVVAVGLSLLIARRMTGPLLRVADASRRLASGDLTQRVPVEGDGEVAEVARQFNGMAEALSEARRREHEFLANVSHELRTPLTAIRGYAEALTDGTAASEESRADAVHIIADEAARLELLLRDVIDLARLGAKELRLDFREVSLDTVFREAVAADAARAAAAGVTLTDTSDPALAGVRVVTDPLRVRQIVSNLVDNALRVTPPGGAIRVGGRAGPGEVLVEVADTGPGIAAADLPHIFERSYLWGKSKDDRAVGTGLGLAIVRDLATVLGGRIDAYSTPGQGTSFVLRLPVRPAGPPGG